MRVLGISGSPRKLGNSEVALKLIGKELGGIDVIRLSELDIKGCKACYRCLSGEPCPLKDDMEFLLSKLSSYDAFVISSPTYFFSSTYLIKRLLDRGFLFYRILPKTWGKPTVLVTIYGLEGMEGLEDALPRLLAISLGLKIKASVVIRSALPGDIMDHVDELRRAAKALKGKEVSSGSGCPSCGSRIVRMEEEGFFCPFCGTLFSPQRDVIKREKLPFSDLKSAMEHRELLRSIKKSFDREKRRILKKLLPYK